MSVCPDCGFPFTELHSDKRCGSGPRRPESWPPSDNDAYWEMDDWNKGLSQYLAGQPCPSELSEGEYAGWKDGEKLYS